MRNFNKLNGNKENIDQDHINELLSNGYIDIYVQCNGCGTTSYLKSSTFYIPTYIRERFTISSNPSAIYVLDNTSNNSSGGTSVPTDYKYIANIGGNYFLYSIKAGADGNSTLSWKYVRVRIVVTPK